ncbi:MAG: DnaA/Hda family protein [candidate division WOR-3 bacterium]
MKEIIYSKFNIAAIKAIRKALMGREVNPLFIYGPSGSGKSFLVENMQEEFKGKSKLVEAEDINPSLLEECKEINLLIIEDLETIPTTKVIMDILFDLLREFTENENKQIVLTANRHPKGLNLPERIMAKIEIGVTVPIKEFDPFSKKKVIEILGKGLPKTFLAKLEKKDIRTMSQAIGAVKKVRLFGYVPDERDELREEKEKEKEEVRKKEEIKKQVGEFEKFIQEVKKGFPEEIVETEKAEILRDEYRAKMFVWEMKGFNTDRIKKVIDKELDLLTGEFVSYTTDIQRLIELQKRYGMLAIDNLIKNGILKEEEKKEIEASLFNPDKVEWLTKTIEKLEEEEDSLAEKVHRRLEISRRKSLGGRKLSKEKMENLVKILSINLQDESFRLLEDF